MFFQILKLSFLRIDSCIGHHNRKMFLLTVFLYLVNIVAGCYITLLFVCNWHQGLVPDCSQAYATDRFVLRSFQNYEMNFASCHTELYLCCSNFGTMYIFVVQKNVIPPCIGFLTHITSRLHYTILHRNEVILLSDWTVVYVTLLAGLVQL